MVSGFAAVYLAALLFLNTYLPIEHMEKTTPEVVFATEAEIDAFGAAVGIPRVIAYYDQYTATIVLPNTFDPTNVYHQALFVHELVHHYQNTLFYREYQCHSQMELEAYEAQAAYLVSKKAEPYYRGEPSAPNPLMMMFLSTCPREP